MKVTVPRSALLIPVSSSNKTALKSVFASSGGHLESLNKARTGLPLALSTPNAIYRFLLKEMRIQPHSLHRLLHYLTYFVPRSFNCRTLTNIFKHPSFVISAWETHTFFSLSASLSPQMFHYLDSKGRLKQIMCKLPMRVVLSVIPSAKSYDGCQADARQPLLSWVFLLVVLGGRGLLKWAALFHWTLSSSGCVLCKWLPNATRVAPCLGRSLLEGCFRFKTIIFITKTCTVVSNTIH